MRIESPSRTVYEEVFERFRTSSAKTFSDYRNSGMAYCPLQVRISTSAKYDGTYETDANYYKGVNYFVSTFRYVLPYSNGELRAGSPLACIGMLSLMSGPHNVMFQSIYDQFEPITLYISRKRTVHSDDPVFLKIESDESFRNAFLLACVEDGPLLNLSFKFTSHQYSYTGFDANNNQGGSLSTGVDYQNMMILKNQGR